FPSLLFPVTPTNTPIDWLIESFPCSRPQILRQILEICDRLLKVSKARPGTEVFKKLCLSRIRPLSVYCSLIVRLCSALGCDLSSKRSLYSRSLARPRAVRRR